MRINFWVAIYKSWDWNLNKGLKQIKLYKIHYSVSAFLKYLAAIFFFSACEALKSSYFIAVFLVNVKLS